MKGLLIIASLALLIGGYVGYKTYKDEKITVSENKAPRYMDIDTYVRTSISSLSPVKEQLGGTFHVTALTSYGGSGTVSYEDGHNAYTADFTYHITVDGQPMIESFVLRP